MTYPTYPAPSPAPADLTCTECLGLVATADVGELTTAAAVTAHCRACPDCAQVIEAVAEEARRFADTLDGVPPGVPAQVVALRAVAGARRGRRRATMLRGVLGVAAVLVVPVLAVRLVGGPGPESRTVELHCLAPARAAALLLPHAPPGVQVRWRGSDAIPALTLSGPRPNLEEAERMLSELDAMWGTERKASCTIAAPPGAPVPEVVRTPPG